MGFQKYLAIYSYHGGGVRGLKRCYDTFSQVDWFDFKRSFINTRENVREGYDQSDYMFYAPVYTCALQEMIYLAHDYWASAVRYTNYNATSIFVDLGCGSGKTLIAAYESKRFDHAFGVELLPKLSERCNQNMIKLSTIADKPKPVVMNLNVEDASWASQIASQLYNTHSSTLFIFNKNSYSSNVLHTTLQIAESYFNTIIYLYQNPVCSKVLEDNGYECFASDSRASNAHKNYKYKLFIKQKASK